AGRVGLPSSVNIVINDKPVANPDYMAVLKNTGSEWLDVLANDTDANGDGLTITNVSSAGWGTASRSAGKIYYEPLWSFSGHDSFTYTISDWRGGTAVGNVFVSVLPEALAHDPAAIITSPTNETHVTAPITVTGTATSDFLQFWELSWRR